MTREQGQQKVKKQKRHHIETEGTISTVYTGISSAAHR